MGYIPPHVQDKIGANWQLGVLAKYAYVVYVLIWLADRGVIEVVVSRNSGEGAARTANAQERKVKIICAATIGGR